MNQTKSTSKYSASALIGASIATLLVSNQSMAETTPFEFKGYFRSGIGMTADGGDQACFSAPGVAKYRLGNECEEWAEMFLNKEVYNEDGRSFKLYTMLAYNAPQQNNLEMTETMSGFFYVEGTNVIDAFPGASLWVGKRYYQRHDVHMNDFFYWNTSGPGAGIENIDAGIGKLSVAWVRSTELADPTVPTSTDFSSNVFDIRLADIDANENGKLEIGLDIGLASATDEQEAAGDPDQDGLLFTAEHKQTYDAGTNVLVAQYGTDGMVGTGGLNNNTAGEGSMIRIVDHGTIKLGGKTEMMYAVIYEDRDLDANDGLTWTSLGLRPVYQWSDILSTAVELGYDEVDPQAGGSAADLLKLTIAQQWSMGSGVWARPSLRLFATYAQWDGDVYNAASESIPDGDDDGLTIGLHAEVWW